MDQKASERDDDIEDFRLKRKFPLVPEPFGPVQFQWSDVIFFPLSLRASTCSYSPELDGEKYYLSKTEEEQMEITARAEILSKHAQENARNKVSEYTWEADLRADLLRENEGRPTPSNVR